MQIIPTTDTLIPEEIPDAPLFVAEIDEPQFKLQGWVVVHSITSNGSCGGVRLYPDVSRQEAELLAKAMTYKYSFHEAALGGAKAVVNLPFDLRPDERTAMLRRFGEHIAPLVKSRIYRPWTDMNCSLDDTKNIYQGAGVKIGMPPGNSAYPTALSTFSAVVATAEYYGIAPEKCKITIEGLGRVGEYLAIEISRWGGQLIGASTRIGAVANVNGLNVREIIEARRKQNDFWVNEKGNWDVISKDQLFSLPMKVHIPCARLHSLTQTVAENLDCRIVAPAANVPCTPDGEKKLTERGIKLLPDFVVNSGGIIGPGLRHLGSSDDEVRGLFFGDFKKMLIRLLKLADNDQESPKVLAAREAHRNFKKLWLSGRETRTGKQEILRILKRRIPTSKKRMLKKELTKIKRILNERFS